MAVTPKGTSPRTVTRYEPALEYVPYLHTRGGKHYVEMRETVDGDYVSFSEVDPLLASLAETEERSQKHADAAASYSRMLKDQEADNEALRAALAETEAEFQRHKDQSFKLYIDACNRADKCQAALAEQEKEVSKLSIETNDRALEIVDVRAALAEAEQENAALRASLTTVRNQFILDRDSLTARAEATEATNARLREGLAIAIDALDNYSDVNDGEDGPVPNSAMSALVQLQALQ